MIGNIFLEATGNTDNSDGRFSGPTPEILDMKGHQWMGKLTGMWATFRTR